MNFNFFAYRVAVNCRFRIASRLVSPFLRCRITDFSGCVNNLSIIFYIFVKQNIDWGGVSLRNEALAGTLRGVQ